MISYNNIGLVLTLIKKSVSNFDIPAVSYFSNDPFKVLVSTILSLRTKDRITIEASNRLFSRVKDCEQLEKISINELERLIYPVGFYKTKAKRLKQICKEIKIRFNGRIPDKLEDLLSLPGVGRKTANLVLTEAFDKDGLCVDTHVHRISNRWGLVKTKNPIETELVLRRLLPKKYWKVYNKRLVSFGQNICLPVSPKCSICPLNNLCPRIGVKKSR